MELRSIGVVRSPLRQPGRHDTEGVLASIGVFPAFRDGLRELNQFSHLVVLYWMHHINEIDRETLSVHPLRNPDNPLVGVFATRSPSRPNPIGMTVVELLGIRGGLIRVRGLDAVDGSPVIDMKPYVPEGIACSKVKIPVWMAHHCKGSPHDH